MSWTGKVSFEKFKTVRVFSYSYTNFGQTEAYRWLAFVAEIIGLDDLFLVGP